MLDELTDTERRIVEYFLNKSTGGRDITARDIASALNVSERTVYKALYKYRKLAREHGLDPSVFYLRGTPQFALPREVPRLESPNAHRLDTLHETRAVELELLEKMKREIVSELTLVLEKLVRDAVVSAIEDSLLLAGSRRGVNTLNLGLPQSISGSDTVLVKKLVENLEKLNYNIEHLSRKLERAHGPGDRGASHYISVGANDAVEGDSALPSFVRNNPWIEVLQKKRT